MEINIIFEFVERIKILLSITTHSELSLTIIIQGRWQVPFLGVTLGILRKQSGRVCTPGPGLPALPQWKSGFSGKVQPVRLIMTLAA